MSFIELSKKVYASRKFTALSLLFLLLFFSLRIFNLDCDLPTWGVNLYTSLDEGTYSAMAIDKLEYGEVNVCHQEVNSRTDYAHRNNVIGNFVTYLSLRTLGDNYYGLRMPSVLWSLGVLLLMFFILHRQLAEGKWKRLILCSTLAVPCISYQFLMASRVVEPSIERAFFVLLVVSVFALRIGWTVKFLLAGFLVGISTSLVYISNAFVLMPLGLWALWFAVKRKRFAPLACLVFGMLAVFVLADVCYYRQVWNISFVQNAMRAVTGFGKIDSEYAASSSLGGFFWAAVDFFANRYSLYDFPVFVCFFVVLPVLAFTAWRREFHFFHLTAMIVGAFLVQTLFYTDYIGRKFIVVYPILCLTVALSIERTFAFWKWLDGYSAHVDVWKDGMYPVDQRRFPLGALLRDSSIVLGALLVLWFVYCQIFVVSENSVDINEPKRWAFILLSIIPLLWLVFAVVRSYAWPRFARMRLHAFALVLLAWVAQAGLFSLWNVYLKFDYLEKDTMIQFGRRYGNSPMLGEWTYSYTLYNSIKPVEGTYEDLARAAKDHPELPFFHYSYSCDAFDKRIVTVFDKFLLPLYKHYDVYHSFDTLGKRRPHAIYMVSPPEEPKHLKNDEEARGTESSGAAGGEAGVDGCFAEDEGGR